jgi:hypothetical protein
VLKVSDPAGALRAIVFGYACHATVLDGYQWSGDYPGWAQQHLEEAHPGCVAFFWAGCGGDQNPLPRRVVELAAAYGRQLAESVDAVLAAPMRSIEGGLSTGFREIPLPLDALPTRDVLERDAASSDRYVASRARLLLEQLDSGQPLAATYPYPIAHWRLGDQVTWVFLGGEVVVDYALRLQTDHGPLWVAAYANDVMAYIPSRRVLLEGGYEGVGAMVYYGLPTSWAPSVEAQIAAEVSRQLATTAD